MPEREEPPLDVELDGLYPEARLPADLEDQVVWALRARGDLGASGAGHAGQKGAGRSGWPPWMQIAAALVLFAGGWTASSLRSPAAEVRPTGFMLLLWEGAGFAEGRPSAEIAAEYGAWMQGASASSESITGRALSPRRTVVRTPADATSPASADEPHIGGYFMVQVETEAQAVELAQSHPHLTNGGWIEVVQLVEH